VEFTSTIFPILPMMSSRPVYVGAWDRCAAGPPPNPARYFGYEVNVKGSVTS